MTGRIFGNQLSVMTMMKGLPLAYNRDMQWDKQPLFDSVEKVSKVLSITARMLKGIKVNQILHIKEGSGIVKSEGFSRLARL